MAISLNNILKWWKTNLIPTEAQIKATFESFRHKNDKVAVADVEGIDNLIAEKADDDKLNSHIEDNSRHLTVELLASLPTLITVFGNKFMLVKHPLNNDPLLQRELQNGDFISNGFKDETAIWIKARCIDAENKNAPESWNVLDTIDEVWQPLISTEEQADE